MRRLLFSALCLLLTGCMVAPAGGLATPIIRVIGPDEAQRIIYDASATAAVVGTQAAYATATDVSARATSTTAARQTADSLMVVQTMLAVEQTRIGALALATDVASVKTQAAAGTRTAIPQTATAAAADVRATAAARETQAARLRANQAREDLAADAWRWGLLIVGVLGVLAFVTALAFGVSDVFKAAAARNLAEAARISAENDQLRILQYQGTLLQLQEGRWEVMETPLLPAPAGDAPPGPDLDSSVREVPVHGKGHVVVGSIPVGVPETPERQRVIDLLTLAINRLGPNKDYIPSAEQLGMHPQEWMNAVKPLKGNPGPAYVITSQGRPRAGAPGRTRLCQPSYKTLGALRDGVKRGDVLPRPELPKPFGETNAP